MLTALDANTKILPLDVSQDDFRFPQIPLNGNGITVQGSVIAAKLVPKKMLEFLAQHRIKPTTMLFPMTGSGMQDAMRTLRDGRMRYCGVLKVR